MRILACPGTGVNFVAGSVHTSTYAFNPGINQYLYFFTSPANNGGASNSW